MAFATIHYHSRSLNKASSFNVLFPDDPATPRPWSAFYLLHGLSDDHTIWMRRTSIERYVGGLPLVVVMPDGGRGWYTNSADGESRYEDDLIRDVVGLVDRTFPVKAERGGRAIGGLSMGGYGAVKIGLKHHEMFASVNSHSGALGFPRLMSAEAVKRSPEAPRIFGPSAKGGPDDPFAIVEGQRDRFLDHDAFTCFEHGLRLFRVVTARRADRDQVDVIPPRQFAIVSVPGDA